MSKGGLHDCAWLALKTANGMNIPCVGYVELDVSLFGITLPRKGIAYCKGCLFPTMYAQKQKVPAVLGMNIIRECYVNLLNDHGAELFQVPPNTISYPSMETGTLVLSKN